MSRLLAIALSLLAGCTLFHGDNSDRVQNGKGSSGGSGEDAGVGNSGCPTTIPESQLLNPETLACLPFPLGVECDPSTCDACPDLDAGVPNWAQCSSSCLGLSEQVCGTTPGCRVTKEANHYYGSLAGDSFLGCFPDNHEVPFGAAACTSLDAHACSSLSRCWAVYDAPAGVQCGIDRHAEGCPSGSFVACVDAGATLPGQCGGGSPITCPTPPPSCPAGTQPGVNDNCYTGLCIPQQYCIAPD